MRINFQRIIQRFLWRWKSIVGFRAKWSFLTGIVLCFCNCLVAQNPQLNAAQRDPSIAGLFVQPETPKGAKAPGPNAAQSAPPLAALFLPPGPAKASSKPAAQYVPPTQTGHANAQTLPPLTAVLAPPKPAKADVLPVGDWKIFKARFVSSDGRVIDSGNENVSHSEGQGYGMLLAVAYGDRPAFDKIWSWTQKHLQLRNDHLFSWRWSPNPAPGQPAVSDPNNASDGDVLIAWALFRAFRTWGDPSHRQASAAILGDLRKCVANTRYGVSLLPAEVGFARGHETVLNPSYSIFQAYREFGQSGVRGRWSQLEAGGLTLISKARVGKWQLSPEWVAVSQQGLSLPHDFPHEFAYNAVRVPLYIAWAHPRSPHLQAFYNFWRAFPGGRVPAGVNLVTDAPLKHPALPGVLAISQWVTACVENKPISVSSIPPLSGSEPYYSACLKLLTKIAIQETNTLKAQ